MNSDKIFDLIEQIAATSKRNEKIALLTEHKDDEDLQFVLKAAYDPTKQYYMKQLPEVFVDGSLEFGDTYSLGLLDVMSTRKVSGNEADETYVKVASTLTTKSRTLLNRIILKDLRCGINSSTINKVWPKLIPEYPYMRCSLASKVDTKNWSWLVGVFVQTKMDGMFCNVTKESGIVTLSSRQGTPIPTDQLESFVEDLQDFLEDDYQYHGELIVLDGGVILAREIGNGILNSVCQGSELPANHSVRFVVWDSVDMESIRGEFPCDESYMERFTLRCKGFSEDSIQTVNTKLVHSLEDAFKFYGERLAEGEEGAIIKHPKMLWKDGDSKEQLKLKLEVDVDVEICGFTVGEGKFADTFGAIQYKSSCGKLIGTVSGIKDDLRKNIHENRDQYIGKILCVRANDIMHSEEFSSLYLPRVVEIRSDKTVADSMEQIVEQFNNARYGK